MIDSEWALPVTCSPWGETNRENKRAAEALGMSRATIYRKIHDYGILAPRG
ncbi:helix-turn-helix domain-containing protein [Amycolatopsis xylanica]|uniref:helix-turn-helix domain-containing protein n=1 Tax=Amycolatopsis xylanica TaxID=589385 RepID=UPI00115FFC18